MKKYKVSLALCFLSLLFIASNVASATSGACSYHGGVNCSAGAALDGKAICNDSTESSVNFSDMTECVIPKCSAPVISGCTTESDYNALNVRLMAQGGYLGGGASQQGALNACRQQINSYQSQYQTYQQCLSSSNTSSFTPISTPDYVAIARNEAISECKSQYGNYSTVSPNGNSLCTCMTGYKWSGNTCVASTTQTAIERCESGGTSGYEVNGQCLTPTGTTTVLDINKPYTCTGSIFDIASCNNTPVSISTSTQNIVPQFSRNLGKGMRGSDVLQLQSLLQKFGYLTASTTLTTYFGPLTQKAVILFQLANSITPAQGFVGSITQAKLVQISK